MTITYDLSPELKKRIRIYVDLFGKSEHWVDDTLSVEEVRYLCEPHPSFLDFLIEKDDKTESKAP